MNLGNVIVNCERRCGLVDGLYKFATFTLMCLALVGCATEEQRNAMQVIRDAQATVRACQSIMAADPQYARAYQKLAIDTVNQPLRLPTPDQLADTEIISDSEKLHLLSLYSEAQDCITPALVSIGRIAPELQIYIVDAQSDQVETIYRVMTNEYTFGQANAEIAGFKQRLKVSAAAAVDNLKARWRQQQAEDAEDIGLTVGYVALAIATRGKMSFEHLASRQALLARAETDYLQMHPTQMMTRRVRVIHCDGIGGTLTCVLTSAGRL